MHLLSAYVPMISLACALFLALAMLAVIVLDITRYTISNSLNLAILVVYAFAAFLLHLDFLPAVFAAAILLAVGLGIFALGLMGGGDVKLLTVLTLWTGWSKATPHFLMLTAIMGGLLVVVVLLLRALTPLFYKPAAGKNLPRILTPKQPVPYGVAIALAFLSVLGMGAVPGLPAVW